MSNTTVRIISSVIIVSVIALCLYLGPVYANLLVAVVGSFILDELLTNFIKLSRENVKYVFSQAVFLICYLLFVFPLYGEFTKTVFLYLNILLDIYLIFFLLGARKSFFSALRFLEKKVYYIALIVFLPIFSVSVLIKQPDWIYLVLGLLLLNASNDAMAWFVGSRWGKRKLWPSVSPKKTIEGALGGIFFSGIFMSLYWVMVMGTWRWYFVLVFITLSIFSILGDLTQSKIKRRFSIKDSSSLIPGHGGVYDRVDSHLFVVPLYILALNWNLIY